MLIISIFVRINDTNILKRSDFFAGDYLDLCAGLLYLAFNWSVTKQQLLSSLSPDGCTGNPALSTFFLLGTKFTTGCSMHSLGMGVFPHSLPRGSTSPWHLTVLDLKWEEDGGSGTMLIAPTLHGRLRLEDCLR